MDQLTKSVTYSLNPCSNGIWSLTSTQHIPVKIVVSLNPCSNGIWSLTEQGDVMAMVSSYVLILVLMEYGL